MANEAQVTLLRQASKVGNRWREENPKVAIDLCSAGLRGTNLMNANLVESTLTVPLSAAPTSMARNLQVVTLNSVRALHTDFTEATLTDTCIADWHISVKERNQTPRSI
ncbi:MAG: hypothetical protein AAF609_12020 [Cyanobacteria bacterium P01_C01_bin.120]